jgi:hypothetical protein
LLVSIDVIPPLDDDHLVVAEDAHPHVGLLLLGVGELVGVGGGGEPKPVPAVSAFGAVWMRRKKDGWKWEFYSNTRKCLLIFIHFPLVLSFFNVLTKNMCYHTWIKTVSLDI